MGKHSRWVIDICDNDMQYPELHKRHSNVDEVISGIQLDYKENNQKSNFIIHKLPKVGAVKLHELTQY